MISGIITLLAIVICIVIIVARELWLPLIFVFSALFLITVIRIICQYKQMGKEKFFGSFQKKQRLDRREILAATLSRFPDYHKVIKMDSADSDYFLISETGLYLFRYFEAQGMITEHENPEYWRVEKDNYRSVVRNEVFFLKRQAKQLEKSMKESIHPYLVISDFANLQIPFDPNVTIRKERNFIFHFEHHGEKRIYTNEQVDHFYDKALRYLEKQTRKERPQQEKKTPKRVSRTQTKNQKIKPIRPKAVK